MKRRELIYAVVMLLAFLPVTTVKIFDIHSDAKFHELYPDDEDRAHREAAAAMEDCPFCHIQLSHFIVSDHCDVPIVPCTILHNYGFYCIESVLITLNTAYLRAPPVFSFLS